MESNQIGQLPYLCPYLKKCGIGKGITPLPTYSGLLSLKR